MQMSLRGDNGSRSLDETSNGQPSNCALTGGIPEGTKSLFRWYILVIGARISVIDNLLLIGPV
jgi:hypothetical protein